MRLQQIAALAWRESRTARRRLLLYMSSISLGVAALVAIDSFADNVTRSVREQSRALLGGDVSVTSRATWSPKVGAFLDSLQRSRIPVARVTTFASMALVPRTGGTRLAQVRAVTPSYPFYGEITTEPAGRWRALHQGGRVALVDPALLVSLDARLGDSLAVGEARFLIIGALKVVPGDPGVSAAIGPRIYIPERHLAETKLLAFGSRAEYEALVKLPSGGLSPARFVGRFERRFEPERVRMRLSLIHI